MKQVLQNYKTGKLQVNEVPSPKLQKEQILVKTKSSLISAGTERTKIETARMSLVGKAVSRLDMVKVVLNNLKQEGLSLTIRKAFNKLDTPISLGYSCAGEVLETDASLSDFRKDQRVACLGEVSAAHSEINCVPVKSAVALPENVSFSEGSFIGLGTIALNAVELAQIKEAEKVAVIGLGLIGQIVTQILKARGVRVIGIEVDNEKIVLAKNLGMDFGANPNQDDVRAAVNGFSLGLGVDSVIIAAASSNNLPLDLAGQIARPKARIILVGAMPIVIPRKDYYEKELFFAISRGFGAGLYYPEDQERDYPYNYRPITIKENMSKFVSLLAKKKINLEALISHRFHITPAKEAYKLINDKKAKYLGIVFKYDQVSPDNQRITFSRAKGTQAVDIGFIGAGSFSQGYLLPALRKIKDLKLVGVATAKGFTANNVAKKFGFNYSTTDYNQILNDQDINCVFIATRHDLHARLVIEALKKGKNVFVEKPLCLNKSELRDIISTYRTSNLMVGFNRRFSPFSQKGKDFFNNRIGPLVINYRINAGSLPSEHWLHSSEGGGRIVGEICHFIDLLQYFTSAQPIEVFAIRPQDSRAEAEKTENVLITLKFSDASIATINYNALGDLTYPRERIEVFGEASVAVIDNFKKLTLSRSGKTKTIKRLNRDMGYNNQLKMFIESLNQENKDLISFKQIALTTITTFKILESLERKLPIRIDSQKF